MSPAQAVVPSIHPYAVCHSARPSASHTQGFVGGGAVWEALAEFGWLGRLTAVGLVDRLADRLTGWLAWLNGGLEDGWF